MTSECFAECHLKRFEIKHGVVSNQMVAEHSRGAQTRHGRISTRPVSQSCWVLVIKESDMKSGSLILRLRAINSSSVVVWSEMKMNVRVGKGQFSRPHRMLSERRAPAMFARGGRRRRLCTSSSQSCNYSHQQHCRYLRSGEISTKLHILLSLLSC